MKLRDGKMVMKKTIIMGVVSIVSLFGGLNQAGATTCTRTITADVVALHQVLVFNRFGSFNPEGMIYALRRDVVDHAGSPIGTGGTPGQVRLREDKRPRPLTLRANVGDCLEVTFTNLLPTTSVVNLGPATRHASIVAVGLPSQGPNLGGSNGIVGIAPGATRTYTWGPFTLNDQGGHLIYSNSAAAGGPGNGGTNMLGLFGAIIIEPQGSTWYRSQTTAEEMGLADPAQLNGVDARVNYDAVHPNGDPVLKMLKGTEIIYSDLNAIIECPVGDNRPTPMLYDDCNNPNPVSELTAQGNYREFTVIMHDETEAIHGNALDDSPVLHGVRDGFAINYGVAGLGQPLLANRSGVGPAAGCVECLYEEFFLTSWANGDPALLEQYLDDPSNVHHSYNNDRVIFRNLHGGVEEGHVFHLHNHQWLAQPGGENSTYLDSQTILPFQAFTYDISYSGSGNRNGSIGDSIFHCHLYPHFAQGMWELWRVHDVFEDGTRTLPDGILGPGTDAETGFTVGGAPIPAVIPIPGLPMAPEPTYPCPGGACTTPDPDAMPGYPFYIPGQAGHRPPQAPKDILVDGGLPRHIVTGGERTAPLPAVSLDKSDFASHLVSADLLLLPQDGTPLERAAMEFHAASGHASVAPDGVTAGSFKTNGKAPAGGAPYSDPCPATPVIRRYPVSAIGLDLVLNKYGWHDPQARINVLDTDIPSYEGETRSADPFFFRANSGECIVFEHTNRTEKELDLDDFQVRTPTDTIGQHIHLVKFDVMASDGSANGWNYEDGTFAKGTIKERIDAANATAGVTKLKDPTGAFVTATKNGSVEVMAPDGTIGPGTLAGVTASYQTTTQRWWADPLYNTEGVDRTIRTVFTHDHFAPSSIQQHGFYNALLIEPAGSSWFASKGTEDLSVHMDPARGIGTQYRIEGGTDNIDHREFALAIADFAIIYEKSGVPGTPGYPINPPFQPESISVEDPGAHSVVNYKSEPFPMRLSPDGRKPLFAGRKAARADLSNIFSSRLHKRLLPGDPDKKIDYDLVNFPDADGDPSTEIFKAYEGDRIQLRLIQGAHENPHVLSVNGMLWKREISEPDSPYVGAQESGISEHFEMEVPNLPKVRRGANTADYLYHFNSTRDMWNGGWGFIRSYSGPSAVDPDTGLPASAYLDTLPGSTGRVTISNPRDFRRDGCPGTSPIRVFNIEAWTAQDLFMGGNITYNKRDNITDPDAILLVRAEDVPALMVDPTAHETIEPLVLRANAGDCIKLRLTNRFPAVIPDRPGDPRMTGLLRNPNAGPGEPDPEHGGTPVGILNPHPGDQIQTDDLTISTNVGLHPQLLAYDVRYSDGTNVGYNPNQTARRLRRTYYTWYAGTMKLGGVDGKTLIATPEEFGPINLQPFGDVIKQGPHGLVAGLIIEPEGSLHVAEGESCTAASSSVEGTVAKIYSGTCDPLFKEFVMVYHDGMNLDQNGLPMPDVFASDDEEDFGEKGINYRTEPHCVRFGLPVDCDTMDVDHPGDFLLESYKPVETPVFTMSGVEKAEFDHRIRIRGLHPSGPQAERGLFIFGHSFPEGGVKPDGSPRLPRFGSPGIGHLSAGKVLDAVPFDGAKKGIWVYRDSIPTWFASGSWGLLKVDVP